MLENKVDLSEFSAILIYFYDSVWLSDICVHTPVYFKL